MPIRLMAVQGYDEIFDTETTSFETKILSLDNKITLGRASSSNTSRAAPSNAFFPSPVISKYHAQLSVQDGQLYVCDLGSTHGTELYHINLDDVIPVNDVPIHVPYGSRLKLGKTVSNTTDNGMVQVSHPVVAVCVYTMDPNGLGMTQAEPHISYAENNRFSAPDSEYDSEMVVSEPEPDAEPESSAAFVEDSEEEVFSTAEAEVPSPTQWLPEESVEEQYSPTGPIENEWETLPSGVVEVEQIVLVEESPPQTIGTEFAALPADPNVWGSQDETQPLGTNDADVLHLRDTKEVPEAAVPEPGCQADPIDVDDAPSNRERSFSSEEDSHPAESLGATRLSFYGMLARMPVIQAHLCKAAEEGRDATSDDKQEDFNRICPPAYEEDVAEDAANASTPSDQQEDEPEQINSTPVSSPPTLKRRRGAVEEDQEDEAQASSKVPLTVDVISSAVGTDGPVVASSSTQTLPSAPRPTKRRRVLDAAKSVGKAGFWMTMGSVATLAGLASLADD